MNYTLTGCAVGTQQLVPELVISPRLVMSLMTHSGIGGSLTP